MKWKTKRRNLGISNSKGTSDENGRISLIPINENGKFEEDEKTKFIPKKVEIKSASYRDMVRELTTLLLYFYFLNFDFQLRYANCTDYLLLFFGFFFSILAGACAPFGSMIFRGISDVLTKGQAAYSAGNFNYEEFSQGIIFYCSLYFLQGLNIFTLNCLGVSYSLIKCKQNDYHKIRLFFELSDQGL